MHLRTVDVHERWNVAHASPLVIVGPPWLCLVVRSSIAELDVGCSSHAVQSTEGDGDSRSGRPWFSTVFDECSDHTVCACAIVGHQLTGRCSTKPLAMAIFNRAIRRSRRRTEVAFGVHEREYRRWIGPAQLMV